jgi:hypothetical protein
MDGQTGDLDVWELEWETVGRKWTGVGLKGKFPQKLDFDITVPEDLRMSGIMLVMEAFRIAEDPVPTPGNYSAVFMAWDSPEHGRKGVHLVDVPEDMNVIRDHICLYLEHHTVSRHRSDVYFNGDATKIRLLTAEETAADALLHRQRVQKEDHAARLDAPAWALSKAVDPQDGPD